MPTERVMEVTLKVRFPVYAGDHEGLLERYRSNWGNDRLGLVSPEGWVLDDVKRLLLDASCTDPRVSFEYVE